MRSTFLPTLILLAITHHFGLPKTHAADAPLPQIRESLNHYYSTIRSLSVTLERTVLGDPKAETKTQIKWAIDRNRKMCMTRVIPLGPSRPVATRQFNSECDGVAYQISNFWPTPDTPPEQIISQIGQPIAKNTLTSASSYRAAGLAVGPSHDRLDSLLMRPEVVVEGQENHDGSLCWRLNLGKADFRRSDVNPHEIIVWLDPAVGFLMRRASVIPSRLVAIRNNPEALQEFQPQPGDLPSTIVIKDFHKVDDPVVGLRWFPKELSFGPIGHARFQITEVAVNRRIPRETFVPAPMFGTRIQEIHRDGTPETQFFGGEEGQQEFLRLVAKHYPTERPVNEPSEAPTSFQAATAKKPHPIDARLDTSWSIRNWSILIAAVLAVIAFLLRTAVRHPTWPFFVILTRKN